MRMIIRDSVTIMGCEMQSEGSMCGESAEGRRRSVIPGLQTACVDDNERVLAPLDKLFPYETSITLAF